MATSVTPPTPGDLRRTLLQSLEANVEPILASARPSGQFGTDPWIVRDQDVILPLTLLYQCPDSTYYHSQRLLEAIAAGGRYLRARQDEKGMYPFDKKDGSNWGSIYMPWTYLRWMITHQLIAAELSPTDRAIWSEGLLLGFTGIAATELCSLSNIYPGPRPGQPAIAAGEVVPWIHNLPCHNAVGLFLAGQTFNRPEWQEQAREYMRLVIAEQSEHGWWTEHSGPVVLYNRVYLESLGVYHALSHDDAVLPALERGNRFHLNYTYPNGAMIETVDERNPYPVLKVVPKPAGDMDYLSPHLHMHPGYFVSDEGRAILALQSTLFDRYEPSELIGPELLLLCLPNNEDALVFTSAPARRFRMDDHALIAREEPWIVSLSAYCSPRSPNRFIQDRQNLISVYHRDAGLILGGGNTKLQPRWSTMTVGDPDLINSQGQQRDSDLAPSVAVAYVPDNATIVETDDNQWTLRVETAGAVLEWSLRRIDDTTLHLTVRLVQPAPDGRPVATHLTFIPYFDAPLAFSDGTTGTLSAEPFAKQGVTWLHHHNWHLILPAAAEIRWPVLPHDPYTATGEAVPRQGRIVVSLALAPQDSAVTFTLTVPA